MTFSNCLDLVESLACDDWKDEGKTRFTKMKHSRFGKNGGGTVLKTILEDQNCTNMAMERDEKASKEVYASNLPHKVMDTTCS